MTLATQLTRALIVVTALFAGTLAIQQEAFADDDEHTWTKRSQKIKGTWNIVQTDAGTFLELDDAFKTRKAPDLKLFLSPLAADDVNANNATSGSVLIAKLKKAKGAQRYEIPSDIDLSQFQTLVLHCEAYTKLWGVSAL
ncbi:MAG: DM13 domain-containing protein [Pseudomonadota bacterium]